MRVRADTVKTHGDRQIVYVVEHVLKLRRNLRVEGARIDEDRADVVLITDGINLTARFERVEIKQSCKFIRNILILGRRRA